MRRVVFLFVIISLILVSCSNLAGTDGSEMVNSDTPMVVGVTTPSPITKPSSTEEPTATITNTPTIQPTPVGGKKLSIAYLGFDCEIVKSERCVMIADFFTHQVMTRIPVGDEADSVYLSWSPNGRYLIYTNVMNNIMHIMLYDMELTSSTEIDTYIYMNPTSESGMVTRPYPNQVHPRWSPNSKYVAYGVRPYTRSVYAIETGETSLFPIEGGFYYWLDDSENLVEIESGIVSNVTTGQQSRVPKAFFMEIRLEDEYIISNEGKNATWANEVYLLSYVRDLETLQENGMQALYEDELYFAYADENDKRDTSLDIYDLYVMGNQIIFSGSLTRTLPYERQDFVRFATMSDMPFHIEIDTETGYSRDQETLLMISPDEKMYFTMDYLWDGVQKNSSLLKTYLLDGHEEVYIYDLHELAEESHDVIYSRYQNLAFHWEE